MPSLPRAAVLAVLAALPLLSSVTPRSAPEPDRTIAVAAAVPQQDSLAAMRQRAVAGVLQRIAGREEEPAENVFRNIRVMQGMPAGRLVRIMDAGFGGSLGVSCGHCHVRGDWSSDDKPQKQVARDMWTMTRTINQDLLPRIPNLDSENPTVNCTTCHRGQIKPATSLQPAGPPAQPAAAPPPAGR